jgi:hypothetical protein
MRLIIDDHKKKARLLGSHSRASQGSPSEEELASWGN